MMTDNKGRLDTFGYALEGIATAMRTEKNLRFEMVVGVIALALCLVLRVDFWAWIVVLAFVGLVLSAELFNTAIEAIVDLVSPEEHPLAKRAKDISAGAVLIASVMAFFAGAAIYIHAFVRLIA